MRTIQCCVVFLAFQASCFAQDCTVPFTPSQFKARLAWQSSPDRVSVLATPVVANMNPEVDSMPEIIVAEFQGQSADGSIDFFRGDGSNATNPNRLIIPYGYDNYPVPGPTVGDIDGDGIPELIMSCYDKKIRVFKNYVEGAVPPMTLWITTTDLLDYVDQRPYLADFDGDGTPEVYAGTDVFVFDLTNPAAPALKKVLDNAAKKGQAYYSGYSEGASNATAVDLLSVADCNGDPDCAGLELAAGPIIYSVDLDPNDGDGYEMKAQRNLNTMAPGNHGYADGYTAAADINQDGIMDLIVTSARFNNLPGVYVWNKNGLLNFFNYPTPEINSGSLACVANVFDDRKRGFLVDLPEILACSSTQFTCFNLNAATQNPNSPYWWSLTTTDFSGWTGSSVYDFNGDGISEIVYRDEKNFRILYGDDAPFPPGVDNERNWLTIPCWSPTSDEYPVVADVDNDGETEIAVTGRLTGGGFFNSAGRLRIFESAAGPWVPCRNLWNQYNYFIVNVNDDLSIPPTQPLHHLELPAPGSGKRPLNRYLSQRPLFNNNYETVIPVPDASATADQVTCVLNGLNVQLSVCNNGDQVLHSGTPVAFYQSDPTTTNAVLLGPVQSVPADIPVDSCKSFSFTVPNQSGVLYGVVNDNGAKARPYQFATDFPVTNQPECNWPNNLFTFERTQSVVSPNLGPDLSACDDTTVVLNAGTGYAAYLWQDGSTDNYLFTHSPGDYWVQTTDLCGEKSSDTIHIQRFGRPMVQLDTINGDCSGHPAIVSAAAQGLYPPMQFNWSTGESGASIAGLVDGMYRVTVTNARGCSATDSTWVEAGGNLQVAAGITQPILCFGGLGTVSLDFSAGRAPFTYLWSDGSSAPVLAQAPAGAHSVTVTDADGCSKAVQITLTQPGPLTSLGIQVTPACPGITNGALSFQGVLFGTPPYGLLWSNADTSSQLTGLASGDYDMTITDANGCQIEDAATIPEFEAPAANNAVDQISCNGANDGRIEVNLSGSTPGIAYQWSNQQSGAAIDSLQAGNYTLTITYADGKCSENFDFQIVEPAPILLSAIQTPAACHGGTGGSIHLEVQNGVSGFLYSWSNGQITKDLDNLTAGDYTVTVTDGTGCSATDVQTVAEWPSIQLTASASAPACAGDANGSVSVATQGGTAPFQFIWSNGALAAQLQNLAAGSYQLTVTDATGCTEVFIQALQEPSPLISDGVTVENACPGASNGSARLAGVHGGTAPWSIAWSNSVISADNPGLPAGSYQLTITDAQGCTLLETAEIAEFAAPLLDAQVQQVNCFGENNGSISLSTTGGTPGFAFLWSNQATGSAISQLAPGDYWLTVTYADGKCPVTSSYAILEPQELTVTDSLVTPVNCFGESNGAIQLSATGGVEPYAWNWSGGQTAAVITGLTAGNYVLTLTDAHHCTLTEQWQVPQPAALNPEITIAADTCQRSSGQLIVAVQGGAPPYQFNWSNHAAGNNLNQLPAGDYQLVVTDDHGCSAVQNAIVPVYGLVPGLTPFTDTITCAHPHATIGLLSDQTGLEYQWNGPAGTQTGMATTTTEMAGDYQVSVTNTFGCTASSTIHVPENRVLPLAEAGPPHVGVPCEESSLTLDASGSSQGAEFSNHWLRIDGAQVLVDTVSILFPVQESGTYVHVVTNLTNGCRASDTTFVTWAPPLSTNVFLDSIRCFGENNGAIHFFPVMGGTAPFYYSIDNQNFTLNNDFLQLAPGQYPAQVMDARGCKWETTVVLDQPLPLSVNLTASDTVLELGQAVTLTATIDPAGTFAGQINWGPAGFDYEPEQLRQRLFPQTHTNYSVEVINQNGCTARDQVHIAVFNHHIYVPNVILPGSSTDGNFTVFAGDGVTEIRLMRIFDRWGELLFEREAFPPNAPERGWDGDFRGKPLDPGVYVWYVEVVFQDGRVVPLKGDVSIIR